MLNHQTASTPLLDPVSNPQTAAFLLQTALVGIERKQFESVSQLLTAMTALYPDLLPLKVMSVLLEWRRNGPQEARRLLVQMTVDFPDLAIAKAMLALADKDMNNPGWLGLAESVLEESRDQASRQLAHFVVIDKAQ